MTSLIHKILKNWACNNCLHQLQALMHLWGFQVQSSLHHVLITFVFTPLPMDFKYSTILLFYYFCPVMWKISSTVHESLGNTFTSKCHNVLHCSKKLYMHIFYLVELLFGYHFFVLQTIGTVTFMLHHIMLFSEFWVQIGHMNLPCWPTESYFERAVHHTSQHFWHIWTMDHCCLKKKKSPKFGQWGTVVH